MRIKMPAVRIAQADVEMQHPSDVLTCGACQKPFALGEIVKFIQHKVLACNKENYSCEPSATNNSIDSGDSDDGGGGGGGGVGGVSTNILGIVGTRRPSISAPIKKVLPSSNNNNNNISNSSGASRVSSSSSSSSCTPSPPDEEPRCSTPKRRPRPSTPVHLGTDVDIKGHRIKEELDSTPPNSSPDEGTCKKLRTDVSDAQSNTTHTEPSNYVCSTCKARLHSAWRLVQHVQNSHGIKIYVESSPTGSISSFGSSPGTSSSNVGKNQSNSSNCSSISLSSGGNTVVTGQSTPLSLGAPSRLGGIPTSSPLVEPHLPLHNPFTVGGLLRMPLEPPRHHQFPPNTLGPTTSSLFARPSSHNEHQFRMDQLVSEQFRLGHHHHHTLAAAVAAVSGCPPPQHTPFGPPPSDRPSPILPTTTVSRTVVPPALPPPSLALPLEPQIDFYSQRLRQLAGTTSPGATNGAATNSSSPSPRKLTSPFTSPTTNNLPPPVSLAPPPTLNNNNNNNTTNNNNNNNNSTNNNNINTRSPTPRPKSSTPPSEQKVQPITTETPPQETSLDMTTTPRSVPSPSSKPTDFSRTANDSIDNNDAAKLHSCNFCGKKFRFQSNLIVHQRCHTGEKPYKCSVCNHACSQSSKLKRHMKVHKRNRNKMSGGEDGSNPNASNSINSTVDQLSNEGSIGTSDDEDDEEMDEDEDEEEDEDDDEEMELEEEEEGDEDDDLGGDAPEDLTTKSTSSTPPATNESKGGNNSGHGGTGTGGSPQPPEKPSTNTAGSLVGELMDKFGLNNIQQYSEAYKQALQESVVGAQHLISKKDDLLHRSHLISDNNNSATKPHTPSIRLENGLLEKSAAALRFREEFTKNIISGQPTLDLVTGHHGLFGTPFENPFDSKRLKLEQRDGSGLGRDRTDSMYAGLWLPAMAAAHHRDQLFGTNGSDNDILKEKKVSGNPGTSASLAAAAAAAAALNLGLPPQSIKKDHRRNDTCEFCGKVFKNCSNLTVHRRSHTGEKPYKCELCSYACAQSSKLTRHMKTHGRMGKDVYRCRFCEMPFSVPSTLEKHMRKCVVNQNFKVDHQLSSMLSGDEDSAASTPKDNTTAT